MVVQYIMLLLVVQARVSATYNFKLTFEETEMLITLTDVSATTHCVLHRSEA